MKKYQIYGIGAALVDTEVIVSDKFLKLNAIEKGVMTLVDEACETLKQSAKAFAVTDGAQGAIVFDEKDTVSVPGVPADAVDTNGAGDMFAGAFMYAVTAGRDFKWAAELANESAARVVGQFGPRLDAIEFDSIKQAFGI